jgi:hypothetical protein
VEFDSQITDVKGCPGMDLRWIRCTRSCGIVGFVGKDEEALAGGMSPSRVMASVAPRISRLLRDCNESVGPDRQWQMPSSPRRVSSQAPFSFDHICRPLVEKWFGD